MQEYYELRAGQECIGKVQVLREGLYYRFVCRCRLTGENVYRLSVKCGLTHEKIGVLVPFGDGFGLDKKIPVKRIGEGIMTFCVSPCHDQVTDDFYPLCPEEPFAYIERLENAYLSIRHGKAGVVFRK